MLSKAASYMSVIRGIMILLTSWRHAGLGVMIGKTAEQTGVITSAVAEGIRATPRSVEVVADLGVIAVGKLAKAVLGEDHRCLHNSERFHTCFQ